MTIPFAEYRAMDGINWSSLKWMARSAYHYQWQRQLAPDKDTKAMRFGRALHTAVLEPDVYEDRHPIFEGKSRRSKAWTEFLDALPADADPLLRSENDPVELMAGAALKHPLVRAVLSGKTAEHVITWVDDETGLLCKSRIDAANGRIVDIKTTAGGSFLPIDFERHAYRMGYHGQAAFYHDALQHELGHEPASPKLIVIEQDAPHDCYLADVADWIEPGRAYYRKLLRQVLACTVEGNWPSVGATERNIGIPPWAFKDFEDNDPITMGGLPIEGY